jgi:hypothetical protein
MTIAIKGIEAFHDFVNYLEDIYKNQLIYRTLIIYKSNLNMYKYLLEQNNNSVHVVNMSDKIDYDKIDCRILLVNKKIYNDFIAKHGNSFYNLVIHTPCSKNII